MHSFTVSSFSDSYGTLDSSRKTSQTYREHPNSTQAKQSHRLLGEKFKVRGVLRARVCVCVKKSVAHFKPFAFSSPQYFKNCGHSAVIRGMIGGRLLTLNY